MIRKRDLTRVVDSRNIDAEAFAGGTRFGGAPGLFSKKLPTNELLEAEGDLMRLFKDQVTHLIAWKSEVGGTNTMQTFMVTAISNLDLPTVDSGFCGRASS